MAMYGIKYRGIHSGDLGLIAKTKTRPAAPPVRTTEETVAYRDGSLDYSEHGGRLFYDDKVLEVTFTAIEPNLIDTNALLSKAVKWLCGGFGDLIFDDMPETVWKAKPIDLSEISYQMYRIGSFDVQFRCKPFNSSRVDSTPVRLSSAIPINTPVALNHGVDNLYTISSTGKYTYKHNNPGDVAVRPKIHITGTGDNGNHTIDIKINGRGFVIKFPASFPMINNKTVTVDCEECVLTCGGNDVTSYLVNSDTALSEFPEIEPGENTIVVNTQITGSILIDYNAPYFFGADLEVK